MKIIREETHTVFVKKEFNLTDEQVASIFPDQSEEEIRNILAEGDENEFHEDLIDRIDEAIMEEEMECDGEEENWWSAEKGGFPINYSAE